MNMKTTKKIQTPNHYETTDAVKLPPHSIEAEQSVLGGLMLDNNAWDTVSGKLTKEDFYRHEHQLIFNAMQDLSRRESPFDVLTIAEALKSTNTLTQAGGDSYLFELANNTPSVANIVAYADIVRERSVLRQMISVARDIADSAYQPEGRGISELLDVAETKVFAIAEQSLVSGGPTPINKLLGMAVDRIDKLFQNQQPITGMPSGFTDLDMMTTGFQPADLVIIAGRPSMGKTTFAMNICENAAVKEKKPVLIFSMEMPGDALALRMISSLARLNQHDLRVGKITDDDWARISATVAMMSELPIYIDDSPGLSPAEVRARARRIAKEHGQIGLIMLDYLQLMQVPGYGVENRTAEISEISRSLKALAKELKVPVLALSQLNRSLEQRADKRPVMSDLRESGAIEQDADLISFIYRDEVYNPETPDKGIAEIIIAKQRNGPIGRVRLSFIGEYTRFDNLANTAYEAVIQSNPRAPYNTGE